MLSNLEIKGLLLQENPIVKHVHTDNTDSSRSPLQPASIDLHVGDIVVPPHPDSSDTIRHPREKYAIPSGGSVVVLTKEYINFDGSYAGLMFPKSSGLAERGILLTNFGHVDPGYKGHLRYAIINLGTDAYEIRRGDAVTCLCIFRLDTVAKPDWSQGRKGSDQRTEDFVRALSPDLLSIRRIEAQATRVAEITVLKSAVWMTLIATLVAVLIGVVSAAVTLGAAWYTLFAPQLDAVKIKVEAMSQLGIATRTQDPATNAKVEAPTAHGDQKVALPRH